MITIIITAMVLELKAPADASLSALIALWPTFIAHGVSFLIVAIYWVKHRHVVG